MPAVPLSAPHHIIVQLLVQVIQQRNSLDNHGVNLVRAELELVAGQTEEMELVRNFSKLIFTYFTYAPNQEPLRSFPS
jgi:hypothetical protein